MSTREPTPTLPYAMRQQVNFDFQDRQLAMLDDNARFIVRRMIGRAYGQGFDDGWSAGKDDAQCDRAIERDRESAANSITATPEKN